MTASPTMSCGGVFCGDRNLLISELADSEHVLARGLAAHREVLRVALTLLHEQRCDIDHEREAHHRRRAEYRRLRETMLADKRRETGQDEGGPCPSDARQPVVSRSG